MLQRYITYYDQRKGQTLHVKISTPKAVETPKPEENEQLTEEPAPEKSISSAVEQEVMKSVPNCVPRQFLDKIKEHQDVFHWNDKGELLCETKPIPSSHLVDPSQRHIARRKGFEPVGWSVFAKSLDRMNVLENLVRNPQRQSAIREFKARMRDETPNSPSRWLPSPPVTVSPVKKQRRRNASPHPEAVRWLRL